MESSSAERVKTIDELGGETFAIPRRRCKDDIKMDFRDAWGAYITGSGSCSLVEFDISGKVISASELLGSKVMCVEVTNIQLTSKQVFRPNRNKYLHAGRIPEINWLR